MKTKITYAALNLVEPKLDELDPLKYQHVKLEIPTNITIDLDSIVNSWVENFKRCVLQEELKNYIVDSIPITLNSGTKVQYFYDKESLSIAFEGNPPSEEVENIKFIGIELTKKLFSFGMIK